MGREELTVKAWEAYDKALELLRMGDIPDAAEKAWLAVENMRKAIMVASNIPYDVTKKVNLALNIFSKLLEILGHEDLLSEYYALNATLHGMAFYEGLLNEYTTKKFIIRAENWLKKAEKIIEEALKIDASPLVSLEEEKMKIKAKILSENMKILEIRSKEEKVIRALKEKIMR
ncbi:MAG: PaREP1 family protein [Candidatus Njordarchaeales archaeon]